jgi:hypothetical protein
MFSSSVHNEDTNPVVTDLDYDKIRALLKQLVACEQCRLVRARVDRIYHAGHSLSARPTCWAWTAPTIDGFNLALHCGRHVGQKYEIEVYSVKGQLAVSHTRRVLRKRGACAGGAPRWVYLGPITVMPPPLLSR